MTKLGLWLEMSSIYPSPLNSGLAVNVRFSSLIKEQADMKEKADFML